LGQLLGGGGSAGITTCDNAERAKRDGEPERNTYVVKTVHVANEYLKVETLHVAVVCEYVSHNAGNISDKRFCIDIVYGVDDAERWRERCKCLIRNCHIKSIK
jgi:hypothetical protein